MTTLQSFERSDSTRLKTRRHKPEDWIPVQYRCENLHISSIALTVLQSQIWTRDSADSLEPNLTSETDNRSAPQEIGCLLWLWNSLLRSQNPASGPYHVPLGLLFFLNKKKVGWWNWCVVCCVSSRFWLRIIWPIFAKLSMNVVPLDDTKTP